MIDVTAAREAERSGRTFRCAKLFWWFNQGADVAVSVTPKPYYGADGNKAFAVTVHIIRRGVDEIARGSQSRFQRVAVVSILHIDAVCSEPQSCRRQTGCTERRKPVCQACVAIPCHDSRCVGCRALGRGVS